MTRLTGVVLGLAVISVAGAAEKTNIVFILADDLSWGDLGCYGQKLIRTPHIDRLAAEGMRFTNAYAGNSVCAPSRSCLMQGLHPGHARVRSNSYKSYRHSLQPEDVTVANVLQDAGYTTGLFGKWGLAVSDQPGIPTRKGFDEFFGYLNQRRAHSYYPAYLWDDTRQVPFPAHVGHEHARQSTYDTAGRVHPFGIRDRAAARYSFDVIHERSLDFVRRHRSEPFFLYLAHTIPHGPLIVPDLGAYRDRKWPVGHQEWAAMVTRLDSAVGDLLQLLEETGLDERTVVFFASDNGHSAHGYNRDKSVPSIGDHFASHGPTRGRKGDSYDGAFRIPAIARWPGRIPAGTVSDQVWAFWDFLPTAAEIAGVDPPAGIDGISILPALTGSERQRQHEFLYWEFGRNQAVRAGRWFGHRRNGGAVELYDLTTDPQQMSDVSAEHPQTADRILDWMRTSHTPSEVWPGPGESADAFQRRLNAAGVPQRPNNINK